MLIKDARYVITMDGARRVIRNGAVAVDGNLITDVGKSAELERRHKADIVVDARDRVVLPGFVNVHTHSGSAINRGVCDDLPNVLFTIFIPLGGLQTEGDMRRVARAALLDDVRFGTTCVGDDLSLAEDILRIGLRGVLNLSARDADTASYDYAHHLRYVYKPEIGEAKLRSGLDEMRRWDGEGNGMITCHFGPHGPDYCSRELLERMRELATREGKRITIHLAQNAVELHQVRSLYSRTPVEFLKDIGFLGPDVYAAHCLYVTRRDLQILRETGTKVCHSPFNIARFYGFAAPLLEWIDMGIKVGICTDGGGSGDMLDSGRVALTLQRLRAGLINPSYVISGGPPPGPMKVLEMMTIEAAEVLGLEREIGSLEPGKKADIILINAKRPHLTPMIDPVGSIVHYGFGGDVETSIIDGKLVMEDRVIKTVDEERILTEAQEAGERTYLKFQEKYQDHIEQYGIYKMPEK